MSEKGECFTVERGEPSPGMFQTFVLVDEQGNRFVSGFARVSYSELIPGDLRRIRDALLLDAERFMGPLEDR